MATSFSTNTGLSALPEYEQEKDPSLYAELVRIRNALRVLQGAIDGLGGAGGMVVTHSSGDLADGQVVVGNGGGDILTIVSVPTLGRILTAAGIGIDPTWVDPTLVFNTQVANYALVASDYNDKTWVEMNVAGACTLTVPPDATVLCPTGYTVLWSQIGAGQITFTPGSGAVNIRNPHSLTSFGQYSCGGLVKTARANEWDLVGDVT